MQFNKLYNIILESIISQNKQYRKNVLAKSDLPEKRKEQLLEYLSWMDTKTADFLVRYFADGSITSPLDERVSDTKAILRLKSSIDTQGFKGTIDQFIEKYSMVIKDKKEKQYYNDPEFIDKLPQLSQKKQYGNGVVVYRVQDSKKGLQAIRKIVDIQLGTDRNPWCLINTSHDAQGYWKKYSGYPKHVAFQNGKILAFCANNDWENLWWNLNDKSSRNLKTFSGKEIVTDHYEWTEKQKIQKYIQKYELKFNKETQRYDCNGNIRVMGWDCIDNKFPVPFGVIEGDFISCFNDQIIDLTNGPTEVKGNYNIAQCKNLESFNGGPKRVERDFVCYSNDKITNLVGGPQYVGGKYWCYHCINLKNFQGAAKFVGGDMQASQCFNLQSLVGCPEQINGDLDVRYADKLTSLTPGPKRVNGWIVCEYCQNLKLTEKDKNRWLIHSDDYNG